MFCCVSVFFNHQIILIELWHKIKQGPADKVEGQQPPLLVKDVNWKRAFTWPCRCVSIFPKSIKKIARLVAFDCLGCQEGVESSQVEEQSHQVSNTACMLTSICIWYQKHSCTLMIFWMGGEGTVCCEKASRGKSNSKASSLFLMHLKWKMLQYMVYIWSIAHPYSIHMLLHCPLFWVCRDHGGAEPHVNV